MAAGKHQKRFNWGNILQNSNYNQIKTTYNIINCLKKQKQKEENDRRRI